MQAIVFVTHIETEQVYRHFLRLKAESHGRLDTYFCVHMSPNTQVQVAHTADFRVTSSDEKKYLPARHAEKIVRGGTITPGFTDLTYLPALLSPRLASYSHVWIVEYDVDYTGHWGKFFGQFVDSQADLIGTTFFSRHESLDWMWWPSFEAPPTVSRAHYTRSFIPIARLSRRMILQYEKATRSGEWKGHAEALHPTIALHHGFAIEDLGGNGPFTPRSLAGKNYSNTPSSALLRPGTFTTAPANHSAYFHDAPGIFPVPDYLYHPVKLVSPAADQA